MDPVDRPLPAVQRAYFYLVALVAIHMVVLAVANLLRVGAEIAMGAPSGGFTGLPFVFNDFSQPRQLYREQASLALALLVVGLPAWLMHFRVAQRAALRSLEERGSALRSFYLHLVVFVTRAPGLRLRGEIERGFVVRKLAIYFVVLVSALAVMLSAAQVVANIVDRLLGTPDREQFRDIQHRGSGRHLPAPAADLYRTVTSVYTP